jgi:Zn-dependent protease with chaperone function
MDASAPIPNREDIRTREEAEAWVEKGNLVRVHLLPLQFEGVDKPDNITYLPPAAAAAKAEFDEKVASCLKPDMELRYEAEPEFDIPSVVPARIRMTATGDDEDFAETIEVGPLAPVPIELEAEPEPIPPIEQVLGAFEEPDKRPGLTVFYRLGLITAAGVLTLMLLVYVGISLACLAFGISQAKSVLAGGPEATIQAAIAAGCALMFLFMVKPFLSLIQRRPEPYAITEDDEPDLFAFVEKICELVGTPMPRRIFLSNEVNAYVGYRNGLLSMVTNDFDLSIGLPLVYGLNLQQLASVIAHESGHFAQRSGRRVSFCVNTLCNWFGRVVYERDFIDDKLEELRQRIPAIALVAALVNLLSTIPRMLLALLRYLGYLVSCFFIRQMEYNADSYEVMVSGSKCFERTMWRLCLLNAAAELSHTGLQQAYREGRLSDNLPLLIAMNEKLIKVDERRRLRSCMYRPHRSQFRAPSWLQSLFETHPGVLKRIKAARRLEEPGVFDHSGPSVGLFQDLERHGKAITTRYYRFLLKGRYKRTKIVDSSVIVEQLQEMITAYSALDRYFQYAASFECGYTVRTAVRPDGKTATQVVEDLRDAREQMEFRAQSAQAGMKRFEQAHLWRQQARLAGIMIGAGVAKEAPALLNMNVSKALIMELKSEADKELNVVNNIVNGFRELAVKRYNLALQLLDDKEFCAEVPRGDELRARGADLVKGLKSLRECREHLSDLSGNAFICSAVFSAERRPSADLMRLVRAAHDQVDATVHSVHHHLSQAPYPFSHEAGRISIGRYTVESMPSRGDLMGTVAVANEMYHKATGLYYRILGQLALIVEQVEMTAGMGPLPDVPPLEDEIDDEDDEDYAL